MENPNQPLNQTVLMTDVENIGVAGINAYENTAQPPNKAAAALQFTNVQTQLRRAGINIISRPSPAGCPDGVYTANWAVTWNGRALLSKLPNARATRPSWATATAPSSRPSCASTASG